MPLLPCEAGEVARERVRSAKPRDGGGLAPAPSPLRHPALTRRLPPCLRILKYHWNGLESSQLSNPSSVRAVDTLALRAVGELGSHWDFMPRMVAWA